MKQNMASSVMNHQEPWLFLRNGHPGDWFLALYHVMPLHNWELSLIIFIRGKKQLMPGTGYTEVHKALFNHSIL